MKKTVIIACALSISMHNQITTSDKTSTPYCLNGHIYGNIKAGVYFKKTLDRNETVIRSEQVTYDQAAYPQELISVDATHITIIETKKSRSTMKIPLADLQGKSSYKLPDGQTIRFTEARIENGIKIYDMPKISSCSCSIS